MLLDQATTKTPKEKNKRLKRPIKNESMKNRIKMNEPIKNIKII